MPGAKFFDYYDKQLWRVLVVARGPEGQSLDKSTVFNSKYNGQKKKASVGGPLVCQGRNAFLQLASLSEQRFSQLITKTEKETIQ